MENKKKHLSFSKEKNRLLCLIRFNHAAAILIETIGFVGSFGFPCPRFPKKGVCSHGNKYGRRAIKAHRYQN